MTKICCATRAQIKYQYGKNSMQPVGQVLVLDPEEHARLSNARLVGPLTASPFGANRSLPNFCVKVDGGWVITKGGGWYIVADENCMLVDDNMQGFENAKSALSSPKKPKSLFRKDEAGDDGEEQE